MIGIEKPNIEVFNQEENSTYGKFTLEPLERGFGTTLGNSMRRVLLSSLPGYAITSVKIDGKVHEFDTIPGVKEDITEIVLNLKSVIIKINGDGPKTAYIDATGRFRNRNLQSGASHRIPRQGCQAVHGDDSGQWQRLCFC